MGMFTFQDLILFGIFLIALLAYIDRDNKRTDKLHQRLLCAGAVPYDPIIVERPEK